jgi:hypothetical protein
VERRKNLCKRSISDLY